MRSFKLVRHFWVAFALIFIFVVDSFGQCPSLRLEQPNPNVPTYDLILDVPTGGLSDIYALNFTASFTFGATNLAYSNLHSSLDPSRMNISSTGVSYTHFIPPSSSLPLYSFSGPTVHLFTVSFAGPVGQCLEARVGETSQVLYYDSNGSQVICSQIGQGAPFEFCFDGVEIAGTIEKDAASNCAGSINNGIPNVQLSIRPPTNGGGVTNCNGTTTNGSGSYSCDLILPGYTYFVTPSKNDNPACGITSLDFGKLQGHIWGINSLTNYEELIAADYNSGGTITYLDLIQLHRYLIGSPGSTPPTPWRFFQSQAFGSLPTPAPNTTNLFNLPPEKYGYVGLVNDVLNADFVGVKIGDINGSCTECSSLQLRKSVEPLQVSTEPLNFFIPDQNMQQGMEYLLPITVEASHAPVSLYNLGLQFDKETIELLEVLPAEFTEFSLEDFNLEALRKGELRHLWFAKTAQAYTFKKDEIVFYLKVRAKANIKSLQGLVRFDDNLMEPVAYLSADKAYPVSFQVFEAVELDVFPSPFTEQLQFRLPVTQNQTVQIAIFDGTGRQVGFRQFQNVNGQLDWTWKPNQKLAAGVYYYQVKIGGSLMNGKVLKL